MIARELARHGVEVSNRNLPADVLHAAKRCLIDWYAAVICGGAAAPATLMADALAEEVGQGDARLLPKGTPALPRAAALINGTAAHTMEVDDIYRWAVYHPGPPVIAAVLAAAQARGADGLRLLKGIVAGYEVSNRLGQAVQPAHYDYWHTTGTIGTFGAAAGVAALLGLGEEETRHAIANAATTAAGLQQAFASDSMGKPLHAGHAAETGLKLALMAEKGVTGADGMVEGPRGFANAMSRDVDWEALVAGLNSGEYTINKMTQKNYTCCGHMFAAMDAALALRQAHGLSPRDVAGITVRSYAKAAEICGNRNPSTVYEAKFSLTFALAVVLVTGGGRFAAFSEARLADAEVRGLMERVVVAIDDAAEAAFPGRRSATVEIETVEGNVLSHHSPTRKGDPDNPLSDAELEDKFRELSSPVLGDEETDMLLQRLWRIDAVQDLRDLAPANRT